MKQSLLPVCIITLLIASCNFLDSDTPTPVFPTGTPNIMPTSTFTDGNVLTLNNVSLVIPEEVANDAELEMVSAKTDGASWELAPEHLKITLTGYALQDKFHKPELFVYPADEYAQVNSIAAEQIDRLKMILAGSPALRETLPRVPFFNAEMQIAANIQTVTFQSGSGVRHLTQYAQYLAPISNHGLFYQFSGLTTDEQYYIVAVLPITAPILAEDENPDAPVPTEGVPIPTDIGPNDTYYASITEKLVSLTPESFTPSLTTLDTLIQSILVTRP
ncbi:MAG TPA: hypothetical protein VJM08_07900 [Anaerolineales bacterium]|nr:hypothetical protein [Anaerolineales bacterium]